MRNFRFSTATLVVGILILSGMAVTLAEPGRPAKPKVDFNRDIRPILSKNCFACHGADDKHRSAGLRLDVRDSAVKKRKNGRVAIVPGKLDEGELIRRITTHNVDERMPPEESGNHLTAEQIETLKRWAKEGAPYAEHWAFVKPQRITPPSFNRDPQGSAWTHNPIDAFVRARLKEEGLQPSPAADRFTLLRRASLDLRGLPPSLEEIDAFAKDSSPDAYEKMVDKFLADPAYGERWARVWMDLARYADSAGLGSDPLRPNMWRYRDWVIDAFNKNMPYDRFTTEQLAGDLLPNATESQKIATAFHRNTMTNTEGGTDDEEFRVAAVKDRANTTMQVWMGLTLGCAQCHTHKYDPITQKEYYRFYAIFNQTTDNDQPDESPTMAAPTPEQAEQDKKIVAQIDELKKKLNTPTPELAAAQAAWENDLRSTTTWITLDPMTMQSEGNAVLKKQADGSIKVEGPNPPKDAYTLTTRLALPAFTGLRLETIPDATLPNGGSGRAADGNFVLSRVSVLTAPAESSAQPIQGQFVRLFLPGPDRILSLAEVQVFGGTENVALKGKASQSSTEYEGFAPRANDGNTNGDYERSNSVTHTAAEKDPWWEVQLSESKAIDRIVVWNRTDNNVGDRLAGGHIQILDATRKVVWETVIRPAPKTSVEYRTNGQREVPLAAAIADYSQGSFPVEKAIAGDIAKQGWAVAPRHKQPHTAHFFTAEPVSLPSPATLTVKLEHRFDRPQYALGRFRLAVTADPKISRRAKLPADVLAAIDLPKDKRTPAQAESIDRHYRTVAPALQPVRDEIAKMEKSRPAISRLPILVEVPAEKRRVTKLMNKGNFLDPGEVVEPGVLATFHPLPKDAAVNRLGVAQWLVHPDNPLTARVAVNRFWAQLFGVGLVETEEDFGTQGELPSHPELLDWLAIEYRDTLKWDTKALLKLIVTSAAYRQSSRVTPELLQRDPRNRLLSRGPRYRLEAEMVRDQALALSGLLHRKLGGPSVYPPQPDGLWQAAFNGDRTWKTSTGPDRYRRGLYTFWRRTVPYPSMAAFDAPSREICAVKRTRSNTPVQAFVTLNDPVYVEAAQALARRIVREGGNNVEERARFALRLCLARPPEAEQVQKIVLLFQDEREHYRKQPAEAMKLCTDPLGPIPAGMIAEELAAWTVVANVLLNLDGVLTKG